jgi:hypothetical protein
MINPELINEPSEMEERTEERKVVIPKFQLYDEGTILEAMPSIPKGTAKGIAFFMDKRLNATGERKQFFKDNYFTTSMAIARNKTGEVVYALNPDVIYTLNPESPIHNGSLPIDDDVYSALKKGSFVLKPSDAKALQADAYDLPKTREAFWEFAAEGKKNLRKDYTEDVTKTLEMPFKHVMGLYVPSTEGLRLVWLGSVGDDWSNALGGLNSRARLVGGSAGEVSVVQKSDAIRAPSLEQIMQVSGKFVPAACQAEYRESMAALYK